MNEVDLGITCDGANVRWRWDFSTGESQSPKRGRGVAENLTKVGVSQVKCTRQAYYVVTAHMIDFCMAEGINLSPKGNWSAILCPQCTAALTQSYARLFISDDEMVKVICQSCESTYQSLHEVIQVDHLMQGATLL